MPFEWFLLMVPIMRAQIIARQGRATPAGVLASTWMALAGPDPILFALAAVFVLGHAPDEVLAQLARLREEVRTRGGTGTDVCLVEWRIAELNPAFRVRELAEACVAICEVPS